MHGVHDTVGHCVGHPVVNIDYPGPCLSDYHFLSLPSPSSSRCYFYSCSTSCYLAAGALLLFSLALSHLSVALGIPFLS
jgi:hypothetical protein